MTVLTDEMRADGWIEHDGRRCPVPLDSRPGVMFRDGEIIRPGCHYAREWRWCHRVTTGDIIAYKLESPDA